MSAAAVLAQMAGEVEAVAENGTAEGHEDIGERLQAKGNKVAERMEEAWAIKKLTEQWLVEGRFKAEKDKKAAEAKVRKEEELAAKIQEARNKARKEEEQGEKKTNKALLVPRKRAVEVSRKAAVEVPPWKKGRKAEAVQEYF